MTSMCQQQQPQPFLKLRMKPLSSRKLSAPPNFQTREKLEEGLRLMVMQEASSSYRCHDYLTSEYPQRRNRAVMSPLGDQDARTTTTSPRPQEQQQYFEASQNHHRSCQHASTPTTTPTPTPATTAADVVDTPCRQKMVFWSYRLMDYFHANREIVATAFSYLDRFMDYQCHNNDISTSTPSSLRSSSSRRFGDAPPTTTGVVFGCDRTSFKLAALTSLYLAAKLFHRKEITMTSMAELSQGEFDVMHIVDMERALLHALEWKLHPPTAQDFVHLLQYYVPHCYDEAVSGGDAALLRDEILQRALFFAEMSVFDSCLLELPRSGIAMAALLNAIEGMEECSLERISQGKEHAALLFSFGSSRALGVEHPTAMMEFIRNRLWYMYSQSGQYKDDELLSGRSQPQQHQGLPAVVTPPRHKPRNMSAGPISRKPASKQPQHQQNLFDGIDHSPISIVSTATCAT